MGTGAGAKRTLEQVRRWANELIDLSRRNTSLYYRPLKRGTLRFIAPAPVTIHDLLGQGGPLHIYHPPPASALERPWTREDALAEAGDRQLVSDRFARADLEKVLRNLDRQTQLDLIDRGLESLYVCFGMLEWREKPDEDTASSPLLFVPVELKRDSPRDPYRLQRAEGDAVLNPSLRVLMTEQFGIELPAHSAETPAEEDLEAVLESVRDAVRGKGWRVDPAVVLKRATFHKEAMFRDLLDHLEQVAAHPIVAALADPSVEPDAETIDVSAVPDENEVDEVAPPEQSHLIMDADASQRRAIAAAGAGVSFVMDGPPGTGKSQTISNLIAELIAAGRSVLFVSEKMAALDVVADRLRRRGLGDFLFELHSHKVSRRAVAAELGRSLRFHPSAHPGFGDAEATRYKRYRESLTGYAEAVNRVRQPIGRSAHWVLGRLSLLHDYPTVPPPAGVSVELSARDVTELAERFARLARVWAPVEHAEGFAWRGLRVDDLGQAARNELLRAIGQLGDAVVRVDEVADEIAFAAGFATPDDLRAAEQLAGVCALAAEQPVTEAAWWGRDDLDTVAARIEEIAEAASGQRADVAALAGAYGGDWAGLSAETARTGIEADAALAHLAVPAGLARAGDLNAARARAVWLRQTRDLADELAGEGPYLAAALGATERERTMVEIGDLAEVGARADAALRPERRWAIPSIAAQVAQAVEVLAPLIRDYQERRGRLAEVFDDDVYELDLQNLVTRFDSVHTGWRKLGGAFRDDKRTVAGVSRSKRAGKAVRAHLPEAFELQQLALTLDERESQSRDLLGRFYRPRASDVDAAGHALAHLRFAVHRLGADYNPDGVAAQLAGDAPADLDLGRRGQQVVDRLTWWRQAAAEMGAPIDALGALTPAQLRVWAEQAATLTEQVHGCLETFAGLRLGTAPVGELLDDAQRRVRVDERAAEISAAEVSDRALLGCFADGFDTDVDAARHGLRWVRGLQEQAGGPLRRRAIEQLHDRADPPDPTPLRDAVDAANKLVDGVVARFEAWRQDELRGELIASFVEAQRIVAELLDHPDQIEVWQTFITAVKELRTEGWAGPLDACIDAGVPAARLEGVLEKALYTAWFDAVAADDDFIGRARADDLDAIVTRFRELDHAMIDDAAEWVTQACTERRPRTIVGVSSIIEREAQKRSRHMPVRTLLEKTSEVAQSLKPCFMMSPLAVSQFLPAGLRFDTVIFDEASQITPADAINCIYRGDQLVVAGDDRQLPPTSFFDVGLAEDDDTYDDAQFDDFESVLGLCKASANMPSLPLRWHYRSKHEALITFSNYRFYDGELITYPGARSDGDDLGVELFVVDGVYRRGGRRDNPIEAEAVADRVLYHAEHHPHLTLGVVTFSQAQAETIEAAIEQCRIERPDLEKFFTADRLDGFFVKNLESVQGDERDVMIFSIGYGFDEDGKITLNFGPLTRSGGWRRLNVAVTRARRRVEVVASFRAGQLPTAGSSNKGVLELQRYLDYADRGMPALAIDLSASEGDVESPFEESVFATLRSWGYDVVPQVGTAGYRIDLGVRHPNRPGEFALGVECDGAAYHSSRVARDRDRLRQEVLEGLGWRLHRIWGPSWYRDRAGQERRLQAVLHAAINGNASTDQLPNHRRTSVKRTSEEVTLDALPEWATHYEVARRYIASDLRPHDPRAFSQTVGVVQDVLAVEAPAHLDVLARRVADAYECNLTKRVRQAVADAVLTLARQGKCSQDGDWVWTGDEFDVRIPSADPASRRDIEHIPPQEVEQAVYALLCDARAATDDELLTQVGRLFGIGRITNRARTVLDDALAQLESAGKVILEGGIYRAADE